MGACIFTLSRSSDEVSLRMDWSQVRDLWPRPPQREQRCSLFLREVADEDSPRRDFPCSGRAYSILTQAGVARPEMARAKGV